MAKQIVSTPSLFKLDDTFEDDRFCRVRIAVMHSGINRNNSMFTKKSMEQAKDTFANIPILANVTIHRDKNGNEYLDYSGHDMHLEDDLYNDGEQRMIYDEKIVGIVPETNNFEILKDDETGEYYLFVDALLYRDYGNYCVDILEERGGTTDISMEIDAIDVAYSSKDKALNIKEFVATGITLLGGDVTPAMKKANATIFSLNEDSRHNQLIEIMQELKQSLDNYTSAIQADETILRKENEKGMKFEELLAKYNISAEDVDFEYEDLDDSQLEEKFAEVFGTQEEETETHSEDGEEVVEEEVTEEEVTEEDETTEEPEKVEEETSEEFSEETEIVEENSVQFSLTYGDEKLEFATSLSEKLYNLSQVVNAQYSDDETWYSVDAYDDPSKYVVMIDVFTGRAYKQDYKIRKGEYQLVGDRVQVYSQFLTQDEIDELDNMRKNYSSIEEKLEQYEAEPEKIELLNSNDYAGIKSTEEYAEISKRENYFDLSKEELTKKLDEIMLSYAKQNKLNYSVTEPIESKSKIGKLPIYTEQKVSNYGSLLKDI